MKKWEITIPPSAVTDRHWSPARIEWLRRGRFDRIHRIVDPSHLKSLDDDPVIRARADLPLHGRGRTTRMPSSKQPAGVHVAPLHDVLVIDHQQIFLVLVGEDGGVGDQR